MPHIEIKDLKEDITVSEEELKHVKGGLLPANQYLFPKLPTTTYKIAVTLDTAFPKVY